MMEFRLLKPEDFITTNWSGGTTTQLFIFPPTADYQKRDFDFRISTAKVAVKKSDFTSLPGVSRKIMILEGEITIKHENRYVRQLKKFDTDEFEGDWKTSAIGTCTDFNVMTKNRIKSEVSGLVIAQNGLIDYKIEDSWNWLFVYGVSGKVRIKKGNEILYLEAGNLLIIRDIADKLFQLAGESKGELVFVKIKN